MQPIKTANAMNPAPAKGIQSLPTPVIDDVIITEVVNAWKGDYQKLEYGTMWDSVPHGSQQGSFPEHKLVFQQVSSEDGQWVKRIWANDRVNQDSYNYAIKYSAGSQEHPIYTRTYVVPRETYFPLLDLTPDEMFPNALLVDEVADRSGNELDSKYITVTRVFETLPGPAVPTKRYNERGDLESVSVQTVPPRTLPDPDGLLITGSQVVQEDVSKGVKTTSSVESHSTLKIKENREGLLGITLTTDNIVSPTTEPDFLSESVVASVVQQTSATKAVKRTTTSTGPKILSGKENKDGLMGIITKTESIVPVGSVADTLSFNIISSEVTPIDYAKSKKTTITHNGPNVLIESTLVDSPSGLIEATGGSYVYPIGSPPADLRNTNKFLTIKESTKALDQSKSQTDFLQTKSWPLLNGVEYDEVLGIPIQYTEQVVSPTEYENPPTSLSNSNNSYKPLDQWKTLRRSYNKEAIATALLQQYFVTQTQVQINLPNKLLEVTAYLSRDYSEGKNISEQSDVGGNAYGYTVGGGFKSSGSISADIYFKLENGFNGYIDGEEHTFFMEISENGRVDKSIIQELNDRNNGKTYLAWPNLKKITQNVLLFTGGKSKTESNSKSEDVNINGFANADRKDWSYDIDTNVNTVTLPDALHGILAINEVYSGPEIPNDLQIVGGVQPKVLKATNPPNFPVGNYLIASSMDLFKYGLVKVKATTVTVTAEYV
jgi:hypothetical protein